MVIAHAEKIGELQRLAVAGRVQMSRHRVLRHVARPFLAQRLEAGRLGIRHRDEPLPRNVHFVVRGEVAGNELAQGAEDVAREIVELSTFVDRLDAAEHGVVIVA